MGSYAVESGVHANITGGPYDGWNANEWAGNVFLAGVTTRFVFSNIGIILGLWEFMAFLPAEIVLWQRLSKKGSVGRSSFAPWTTLVLRYSMLCYAIAYAFEQYSTTQPSDAACKANAVFIIIAAVMINCAAAFAIAWRAQAVARGVIHDPKSVQILQILMSLLVFIYVFIIVFSSVYDNVREGGLKAYAIHGRCTNGQYQVIRTARKIWLHPAFWAYVFTIIFNIICLALVAVALRILASRSRGFSKFISGMFNHSLFYFITSVSVTLLLIIWNSIEYVPWLYGAATVVQAAVMTRILLAEQDAARRPLDTTYIDGTNYASRQRSLAPPGAEASFAPRADTTVQFADQQHGGAGTSGALPTAGPAGAFGNSSGYPFFGGPAGPLGPFGGLRSFHQPYNMMDNLGQAFSHIDSRNPGGDIEEQTIDMSDEEDRATQRSFYNQGTDTYTQQTASAGTKEDTSPVGEAELVAQHTLGGQGPPRRGSLEGGKLQESHEMDLRPTPTTPAAAIAAAHMASLQQSPPHSQPQPQQTQFEQSQPSLRECVSAVNADRRRFARSSSNDVRRDSSSSSEIGIQTSQF